MKRFLTQMLLVAALGLPWAVNAQGTLTVADGTATNRHVPLFGYYMDEAQHTQVLYPDSMLTGMRGQAITSLAWSANITTASYSGDVSVALAVVVDGALTDFLTPMLTEVWAGQLSIDASGQMTLTFDDPFLYPAEGGNLLVDLSKPSGGTYSAYNTAFYGDSLAGACWMTYDGTHPDGAVDFLPRTTFTYSAPLNCRTVGNIAASDITVDQATLSWVERGEASLWQYAFSDEPLSNPNDEAQYTTDTTVTFYNLDANTLYYFYVRPDCGDDTSDWRSITFRTACTPFQEIPFSESFEGYATGATPSCWQVLTASEEGGNPCVSVDPNHAHTGTGLLSLYDESYYNSVENLIATPRFEELSTLEVTFWAKTRTGLAPDRFVVGVVDDSNAFLPIDTLALQSNYGFFTVAFDSYEPYTPGRMGFYAYSAAAGWYGAGFQVDIDDLNVHIISSCAYPRDLATTGNTSTSVSLSWSEGDGSQWDVAYGPRGFTPSDQWEAIETGFGAGEATIYDLSDSVTYDFYVRTVCGGEYSLWSGPVTVRPGVYAMPVSGVDTLTTCGITLADDGGILNPYSAYAQGTVVILPEEEEMAVRLRGSVETYSDAVVLYEGIGTGGRCLGSYRNTATIDTVSAVGPMTVVFNTSYFADYAPESCVGFELAVSCEEREACPSVTDLVVTHILGNGATLLWNHPYADAGFTLTLIDTLTSNELTFSADTCYYQFSTLTPETPYWVSVVANCASDEDAQAVTGFFQTPCLYGGDVIVGEYETQTDNYNLPFYGACNSFSQQIFTAQDLRRVSDTVTGLSLYLSRVTGSAFPLSLYVDTTNLTSFSAASDFVPQSSATLLFCDTVDLVTGWNYLPFSRPMVKRADQGLLVTFHNNASSYSYYNAIYCNAHYAAGTQAIHRYSSNALLDPTQSQTEGNVSNSVNTLLFHSPCMTVECMAPAVSAVSNSATIDLSWVPGTTETEWSVEYRAEGDADWTLAASSVSATAYTLSGLAANTSYQVRVTSLCPLGGTAAATLGVSTLCEAVSVPLVEDFEDFVAPSAYGSDFENCWNRIPGNGYSWSPCIYSQVAYSGNYCLYLSGTNDSYLVLPRLAQPIDSLALFAKLMGSAYTTMTMQVGVMTNPNDASTFTLVGSFTTEMGDGWQDVELSLDSYQGPAGYIAITAPTGNNIYFDDLRVDYTTHCQRVENITLTEVVSGNATFTWVDPNDAGSYTIAWGTGNSVSAATDSLTVSTTSATITGLAASTNYYAWVRTNCPGEHSWWAPAGRFSTGCATIVSTPYTEDFESYADGDVPLCWEVIDQFSYYGYTYPSIYEDYYYGTGKLLSFQILNQGSTLQKATIATPAFSSLGGLQLTFYAQTYSYASPDRFTVGVVTDGGVYIPMDTLTLPTNMDNPLVVNLDRYAALGHRVAFSAESGSQAMVELDDILIDTAISCPVPTDLACTATTASTATLSWTENGTATTWEMALSTDPNADFDTVTLVVSANANPFTVTGLQDATTYYAKVRAVCSAEEHSDWTRLAATFTTRCLAHQLTPDAPIYEGFESPTAPATCWSILNTRNTPTHSTTLALEGERSFRFSSYTASSDYNQYLVSPAFQSLGAVNLSFFYATSSTASDEQITVGYSTSSPDPTDSSAWVWGESIQLTGQVNWTQYLDTFPAEAQYIAIHYWADCKYYVYIDSLLISTDNVIPCTAPSASLTSLAYNEASFSWSSEAELFEYALRVNGEEWPEEASITGNMLTLSNLQATTDYQFRLRARCNETSVSDWILLSFTTPYMPCFTPEGLTVGNISYGTAELAWQPGGSESQWMVRYWYGGVYDSVTAEQPSITLSGLMPATDYHAQVRALCPSGEVSGWSEPVDFRTAECMTPTNLTVSNITTTTITLDWQENGSAEEWIILYGEPGFTTDQATTVTATEHPYTLTGLTPGTAYQLYIRANCGYTVSATSEPITFTTEGTQDINLVGDGASLRLYPNPATTSVTIEGYEGEVQVIDLQGRVVKTQLITHNSQLITLEALPQGAYFVKLGSTVKKLIIK